MIWQLTNKKLAKQESPSLRDVTFHFKSETMGQITRQSSNPEPQFVPQVQTIYTRADSNGKMLTPVSIHNHVSSQLRIQV